MTPDQFANSLRAFTRRRPFRSFHIEFVSGSQIKIVHPDAIRSEGELFVFRAADGGYVIFPAGTVVRLLDAPVSAS